jgi:hypothetical protein
MYELAQMVGGNINVPGDIIYAQWQHESANFTSALSAYNNFAGVTQTEKNDLPQPDGGNYYMSFGTPEEFANYMSWYYKQYEGLEGSQSVEEFLTALKNGGYFGDSYDNYYQGVTGFMNGGMSVADLNRNILPGQKADGSFWQDYDESQVQDMSWADFQQTTNTPSKELSFTDSILNGFESSTFGQYLIHNKMDRNHKYTGWKPSDADFDYVDNIFKGSKEAEETKFRIMSTAKDHDHMLELIAYEQGRQQREKSMKEADDFSIQTSGKVLGSINNIFSMRTAGAFVGSIANPVNFIPVLGQGAKFLQALRMCRPGMISKIANAVNVGVQTGAVNALDVYSVNKLYGVQEDWKTAAGFGFVAGAGLDMFANVFRGKMPRDNSTLSRAVNRLEAIEDTAAMQIAGVPVSSRQVSRNIEEALDGLRTPELKVAGEITPSTMQKLSDGSLEVLSLVNAKKLGDRIGVAVSDKTRAIYHESSGKVFAIADNITNGADLEKAVLHEFGVHKGLATLGERERNEIFSYVQERMEKPKGKWLDAIKRSNSADPEEVLAHFIELGGSDKKLGGMTRNIRQQLRKAGLLDDVNLTDYIKELAERSIAKHDFTITPNGTAVSPDGVKFSVDNPVHPHAYHDKVMSDSEVIKENTVGGRRGKVEKTLKTGKLWGSDFGKCFYSNSPTLQKAVNELFRNPYQDSKVTYTVAESIKEVEKSQLTQFDNKLLTIRDNWIHTTKGISRVNLFGTDNAIKEFNEQVVKYYDAKVNIEEKGTLLHSLDGFDKEIKEFADLYREKQEFTYTRLKSSSTNYGIKKPNILDKDFTPDSKGFSRKTDEMKLFDFINSPYIGDRQAKIDFLAQYGEGAMRTKFEQNRLRIQKREQQRYEKRVAEYEKKAECYEWIEKVYKGESFNIKDVPKEFRKEVEQAYKNKLKVDAHNDKVNLNVPSRIDQPMMDRYKIKPPKKPTAPKAVTDEEVEKFIQKEAKRWAFGIIDRDASNLKRWMNVNDNSITGKDFNPLEFLNERVIMDTSYEVDFPDGTRFSFDKNLRSYDIDSIMRQTNDRVSGEIAFRSRYNADEEFLHERAKVRSELELTAQGVVDSKGNTVIDEGKIKDIMYAFDSQMSKLRGLPLTEEIAQLNSSKFSTFMDSLKKLTYAATGNNMGVSSIAEMVQSLGNSGGDLLTRMLPELLGNSDMKEFKEIVDTHFMKEIADNTWQRPLNSEDYMRKWGKNGKLLRSLAGVGDNINMMLSAAGRVTNALNQLPRLTNNWTGLLRRSAMKDYVDWAFDRQSWWFRNPVCKEYLEAAGVQNMEQANILKTTIKKYFPSGKANKALFDKWQGESPETFMQFMNLTENMALRGMTRSTIGNGNSVLKKTALGRMAMFYMNFVNMSMHSQFLRNMSRPLADQAAATTLSLLGGGISYAAYTGIMGNVKYFNDDKKKQEYFEKRFSPEMLGIASLTRGAMLTPTAFAQNAAEITGLMPDTVRTTVSGNKEKVKGAGDLMGNFVDQLPVVSTATNVAKTGYNLSDLALYYATGGDYGSTMNQGEFRTMTQTLPWQNFFATQAFIEVAKEELHLPKKEKKGRKSSK